MIFLRRATEADLPLKLAWRNNPLISQGFYSQSKNGNLISWEEHTNWWKSRNNWQDMVVMLVEDYTERPIGFVSIGQTDHWSPEVGFFVGEISLWGTGIGKEAVRQAIEFVREYAKSHAHITHLHTTVKKDNERSIRLLKSLGFEYSCEARPGEIYMVRRLGVE